MRKGLAGEYKGQFVRSSLEYIFAVYLDKVLNVKFVTEPFAIFKKNGDLTNRKIPDFAYVDPNSKLKRLTVVEIKPSYKELEKLIVDYCSNGYDINENISMEFLCLDKHSVKKYENMIIEKIGHDNWKNMFDDYKQKARTNYKYYGFPGEKNPRYGVKLSDETKEKISNSLKGKFVADKNPNFNGGTNYSEEARRKIGEKWKDENKKKKMIVKGFITHISKFTDDEFNKYVNYSSDRYNGRKHKKPAFLNPAYCISSKEKIDNLFGSFDDFIKAISEGRTK